MLMILLLYKISASVHYFVRNTIQIRVYFPNGQWYTVFDKYVFKIYSGVSVGYLFVVQNRFDWLWSGFGQSISSRQLPCWERWLYE
jgi:hypothetical protein